MWILNTPLLALVVAAYNIIVFLTGPELGTAVLTPALPSAAAWGLTVGDLLIALALIFLYVETLKSTRSSVAAVLDHGLSMAVFIVCLVEFMLVSRCGTSVFFIITLISLFDVVAGFTISISSARRDIAFGDQVR
jgi:hypothetical protein